MYPSQVHPDEEGFCPMQVETKSQPFPVETPP